MSMVTVGRFAVFLPGSFCSSCKCFLHYVNYDSVSSQMLYKASWEVYHFYCLCFIACRPGCDLLRQRELREAVLQEVVLTESVICCLVLQKGFFLLYAAMPERRMGDCSTGGTNTGS